MITFKLILCPIDFSNTSYHALDTAIELATKLEARIKLVHIYQYPVYSMPEADLPTPVNLTIQDDYEKRLQEQLEKVCVKYSNDHLSLESEIVEGVPYIEIVHAAKKINADLIVMGTHGRTGLSHMLMGSVAERVVRSSTIPVMSVPDKS
ncbi:MAG: universal stress protein [Gammaproteobacteria bacterium]